MYVGLGHSYTVIPEMNADTGVIIHLYYIEMRERVSANR